MFRVFSSAFKPCVVRWPHAWRCGGERATYFFSHT